MSSEIAIPFRLAPDGRIATETRPNAQIKQHVYSLVLTEPGERVMLPTYGVPLTTSIFELDDEFTQAHLLTMVQNAMAAWEPGIEILSIEPGNNISGDGVSAIQVNYLRREAADTPVAGRKVNTAFIGINGKVTEIVRG